LAFPYIGELAALFTSLCWSLSALAFTLSGQIIGSQVVNRVRVLLAFLMLMAINWIFLGQPIPLNLHIDNWFWLILSGAVGLAIGDTFLFRTYQLIGPRLGLLLLSLAPVFSTLIALFLFDEKLSISQLAGMVVTLVGIGWVILANREVQMGDSPHKLSSKGILFGVIAALGQATGLVLSKQGMQGDISPFAGTLIRMIAGFGFLWGSALISKQVIPTIKITWQNPKALRWVFFGSIFGPVVGISASLLSLQYAKIGIASTLMALPPVFMLPISYFAFKERISWQAVIGTLVAIAGIALIFL
jgi:drug/metabolite transporter (DMT)-like permease